MQEELDEKEQAHVVPKNTGKKKKLTSHVHHLTLN
jgi:hypothetical protein